VSQPASAPPRRTLHFHTLDDLAQDIQALHKSGATSSGDWTPGQIVWHVAAVMQASIEGFPFSFSFPLRILGRLIRQRSLTKGFPRGLKIPGKARPAFDPLPGMTFDVAVAGLAATILKAGQSKMTQASPIFGPLTHEQWVRFHCRHAELHFSFMHPAKQHDA